MENFNSHVLTNQGIESLSGLESQPVINSAEISKRMIVGKGLDHFTIRIPAKQNTCQVITRRVTTSGKLTPTNVRLTQSHSSCYSFLRLWWIAHFMDFFHDKATKKVDF